MSESATVLQPGDKVGDSYEVVRLIGRGGMGEVWAARHLRLVNKQVAVKVLHTKGAALTPEQLARFKREADIATRLSHPNVVEVHDYNTLASGAPYLVLELLQGESLASRIRFGPLSLDEATQVVRQVGAALDASHALNVVHRDLKPDNIFLVSTATGTQVKVLDFGISKVVDSTTLQTQEAVLVGTPQYMSPEQAVGANKDVGPPSDVFALGTIAYEMLSGAPAFAAESIAKIVFRIAYEQHTPLEQVKPGLPPRVYAAVETALEKDRSRRYADVASFVADFSGQSCVRAPPPRAVSETASPSGVASPGMATPDSMAWAATAARTPMPAPPPLVVPASVPAQAVVPPAPPPPQLAPPVRRRSRLGLVLGTVIALAAMFRGPITELLRPQPKLPMPVQVPVVPPPPPAPVVRPAPVPEPAPEPAPVRRSLRPGPRCTSGSARKRQTSSATWKRS